MPSTSGVGGLSDPGLTNLRWAYALVDGLAAAGVTRAVISPGSRSTPLVLACERHPGIVTRMHLDERGAAFLALGQARAGTMPTALIATSGSAPTHWYPALVEASLARLPLILLSADRPPELQDWGANQTLEQQRLFGVHVRAFHQAGLAEESAPALRGIRQLGIKAVEQATWPQPGPVHINLPFREPLIPAATEAQWPQGAGESFPLARPRQLPDPRQLDRLAARVDGRNGLIVCGPERYPDDFGRALTGLARGLSAPLFADPLSGLRFGPWDKDLLLTRYDTFLRGRAGRELPEPEWILRFGAPPVSKVLLEYLGARDAFQALIAPNTGWPDPLHRSGMLLRADPLLFCRGLMQRVRGGATAEWPVAFQSAETIAAPELEQERAADRPFEGLIVPELIEALPDGAILFSGNSLPIRQIDSWSGGGDRPLNIFCNRGASGIDGNVATLLGLASTATGPVVGLLGDLAVLHDLNSLAAARGLQAVIIVLNNGGGGIFGHLPQARLADFERYWLTPQGLELEKAAELFGLDYRLVERQSRFLPALEQGLEAPGVSLIEVAIDRNYSLQRHRAYWKTGGSAAGKRDREPKNPQPENYRLGSESADRPVVD